mmetsp:Transcript_56046/g.119185  ORF Transcript_56046/g.119185 Transcript_56046/m.119185 type:complete len:863 (-) Transcript_56046:16-2604(-)
MLLRVDKVSGGNKPTDPQPSFEPPLHACLATASVRGGGGSGDNNDSGGNGRGGDNAPTQGGSQLIGGVPHAVIPTSPLNDDGIDNPNRSGEILTVGRKNCDVTVDDKCCSRAHASVSLLSNRPYDAGAVAAARSQIGEGRVMMEFGTPSSPEEARACETSSSGVICVVKDKGSKFGTFVSVDEELLKDHQLGNDDDTGAGGGGGDETGDETDDGGVEGVKPIDYVELTEKQVRAVHCLSNRAESIALPKFRKLAAHQSVPLLQLSHSKDSKSDPHVIILFGPQGSGVRLSLLPLLFTFSRVKKPELDPILASLHYVGASHSTQWDVERSTHLVAPEKTAAAKGIMAYACRRPVVTGGFVEALLDRRGPDDGLPKEENYCSPGTWDKNLKYTSEPSAALRGYRVAVMVDDDSAPLAQSAGADILHVHEDAPSSSRVEFDAWWRTQARRARDDKLALVVVGSSSKKCKQFSDWLKQHADGVVRFTNAKNIAKAITNNNGEGELLMDTRKEVVEKIEGWDDTTEADGGKEEEGAKMSAADTSAVAAEGETIETFQQTHEDDENPLPGNGDFEEEESREMPVSTRRKRRQEEEETVDRREEAREEGSERQKRRRKNDANEDDRAEEAAVDRSVRSPKKKRNRDEEEVLEEEAAVNKPAATGRSEKSSAAAKKRRKENNVGSDDDEPGLPAERIPLPTTRDGWLVAAPDKRRAYRREIFEDVDEGVPGVAAETEKVSGLIVRKYVPPDRGGGGGVGRTENDKGKKKDFKGFRKNSVLRGYTSFDPSGRRSSNNNNRGSLPTIRLVDVMPKESERQRQLQQQQEDLEREQELADQLFNDVSAKSGRKRGGTMRAYLTQSTAKKARGRR